MGKFLKQIDYRLYFTLLLFGFLPIIYTTVRIHFLGNMPMDWGFNIASQLAWVNVIYEVVQEAILLPIFFFLGKSITNTDELQNKIKTGLIISFVIYLIASGTLITFTEPLLQWMNQKDALVEASVKYIRFEAIASIFSILVQFLILVLIAIKKEKFLLIVLFLQMFLSVLLDTFLVSALPFSLNVGVVGIAYTNIVVNLILLMSILFLLREESLFSFNFRKLDFSWTKDLLTIGGFSGLESFVRNFAFITMVLKMVNEVGEQGTFWVANGFIWGWLLLPILQLGQLVKRDCGALGQKAITEKAMGYFLLTGIIVLIWVVTIPLWKPFMQHVLNISDYEKVYHVVIISLFFYILFAFNHVIDSIFYGIGKTNYMLFQSVVVNSLFYGTLFLLYKLGFYKPTLELIVLMFAIGIALDSILTFFIFRWMLKRRKITIC